MTFQDVSPQIDFAKSEEQTLEFWRLNHIFEKSISSRSSDNAFSFYDGPPFATGLPHYGHLLASTIKDIVLSRSKPDRAIVVVESVTKNQHDAPLQKLVSKVVVFRREE